MVAPMRSTGQAETIAMTESNNTPSWFEHLPPEPLFVAGDYLRDVATICAKRSDILSKASMSSLSSAPPYQVIGRTAIVQVRGALVDFGYIDLSNFGATSYGHLVLAIEMAAADKHVDRIILSINSPGGMVSGSDSAVDAVDAHVEGLCCSAALLVGAQASDIVLTRGSTVGSIGVVVRHLNVAGALAKDGVEVTLVSAGAQKTDGHPFGPLSESVRADWQAEVTDIRLGLANDIAQGRGARLSAAAALATEAKMYRARIHSTGRSEAVDAGLADRISTLRDMIASAIAPSPLVLKVANSMTTITATADVATAERDRIKSILGCDEAKGREATAQHLATSTNMTAAEVKALLATVPKATAMPVVDRKLEASLGLSLVDTGEAQEPINASAAWDKIVARQNSSFVEPLN
jgi:ClpP class serine protease